ncbi:hypothetical protein CTA2_12704 [Colletotrichum tanaceti]|uniref:AMP-binding enzyme C-terminal domain-containing protein n=1 Tax=Colletotrichum tanaceti TaxID=1306861 RepID=A0A4U6XR57_9PEZI|nr:hypothetical protein CTA2_12704 [Colletotrichum tanaceti]TKW58304.1 hypothetical protein CTA1_12132 [Colletotrichum tanaceti]
MGNISPNEIEDRLLSHPAIVECCVVGLWHKKYSEVVAIFLRALEKTTPLSDAEVRSWMRDKLGRIKAPSQVFWIEHADVGSALPKTAGEKYQKHHVFC